MDYDTDSRVTFSEAHAFAKVDAQTPDWPVSTSEAWLHRQASEADISFALNQPLAHWRNAANPEQRHIVEALSQEDLPAIQWRPGRRVTRLRCASTAANYRYCHGSEVYSGSPSR